MDLRRFPTLTKELSYISPIPRIITMNDVHDFKDDPESDDAPDNLSTYEAQAGRTIFHEAQAKCGDVFVGCQGNFTLVCSVCKEEFDTFDLFGLHIKGCHLGLKSEPKVFIEHIFTESLPIWDALNVPLPLSREKALESPCKNKAPTSTQFKAREETSQPTTNISSQPNQQAENTGAQSINDIWEEDKRNEESIGDEYTPEDEADSQNQHLQERKEYFCIYCGRTYKSKKSYVAHSKKEHNNGSPAQTADVDGSEKPLIEPVKMVCKYCDKSFDDQVEFKNHVSTHTGRSRFVCPFCPKTFVTRYNRKMHINTHTGERPFKCTHCPKAFSHATNLEMHIRMHLRIMKFSCNYCDKRFVHSTEKKHHERIHTGEKPYQCEECGKRFIAHVRLMEHSRRHKDIKNYKCEVCSKAFYTSTSLKNHMPTHTGERPFLCNICSQTFPRRGSLRAHQQLHSKEKKYVCDMCGKAFAQFAGLYSHRKSHGEKVK